MDAENNYDIEFSNEAQRKPKFSENNFKPTAHYVMLALLLSGILIIIIICSLIGAGTFKEWAAAEAAAEAKTKAEPYPEGEPNAESSPKPKAESSPEPKAESSPEPKAESTAEPAKSELQSTPETAAATPARK